MTQDKMSSLQLSLKINEVLNHVGVNKKIIQLRRNCFLEAECFCTVYHRTRPLCVSEETFYFGSQMEGTTTIGLRSDFDSAHMLDKVVVLTNSHDADVSEDMYTFCMDKFTNRGYCCLRDVSFGKNSKISKSLSPKFKPHHKHNTSYLKNSYQLDDKFNGKNTEREGPARYYQTPDGKDFNFLHGFYCTSWPREVSNTFLVNKDRLFWPSDQLLQDVLQSRCFVVPKGSDNGPDSDIEWRLSFSFGERLLMFDLNTVQIRCYILMKYVKTAFLDNVPDCKGIISSYICKTALFHTVSRTSKSEWIEEQLLVYFNKCLCTLQKFIDEENCPHFIMPLNNLLLNKLDGITRVRLFQKLQTIIESNGCALLDIKIDNFGELLSGECIKSQIEYSKNINFYLLSAWICEFGSLNSFMSFMYDEASRPLAKTEIIEMENDKLGYINIKRNFTTQNLVKKSIEKLHQLYHSTPISEERMHNAIQVWTSMYSTLIGFLQASADFKDRHELSDEAFQWLLLGMNFTDVASAHLKLASILFLIGDLDSTIILLDDINKIIDERHVVSTCVCNLDYAMVSKRSKFPTSLGKKTFLQVTRENFAYCVVYLPEEIYSCPQELQFEIFRASFNGKPEKYHMPHTWYFVTIPQLPFFFFLQYKLYKQLGMTTQSEDALGKLMNVLKDPALLMVHLDTVYNLIGQCLEQKGQLDIALQYYSRSLNVEPVYNAAKILICCNLVKQLYKKR
ncbi:hypothetical protein ACF0H5_023116 [Mactra antiquata]